MELLREWYVLLSRLSALAVGPLGDLSNRLDLPLASAFLFGLAGALAPCQLTTNASAVAFLGRGGAQRGAGLEAAAFVLGKMLVYVALGALALTLGQELQRAAIPVAIVARKALGPVLILIGLSFLGVLRLPGAIGSRLSVRLARLAPASGARRAFAMGAAFALAFCPTLFLLFFGLTVPLALSTPAGFAAPALFAIGTGMPVLLAGSVLSVGVRDAAGARLRRASGVVSRLAGVVLVLLGVHDTLTYWAL